MWQQSFLGGLNGCLVIFVAVVVVVIAETDPDYECFRKAGNKYSYCPEYLSYESHPHDNNFKNDVNELARVSMACIKKEYLKAGCNEAEWVRVCKWNVDAEKVQIIGGQNMNDILRNHCNDDNNNKNDEDESAFCFEQIAEKMNYLSCPEVIYIATNKKNLTDDDMIRQQTACYKRQYLTNDCNIAEWEQVCNKMIHSLPIHFPNNFKKFNLTPKHCGV